MISDVLGLILLVSDGRSGRQEQEKYPSAETTRNLFWKIFSKISLKLFSQIFLELFSQIFLGRNNTENHFFNQKFPLNIFTNILGQKQYRKSFF